MIRGKRSAASLLLALAMILGIVAVPAEVWAQCVVDQQSCSTTYSIDEAYFGTGGQLCDPTATVPTGVSTNYCASSAVGETAVGNAKAAGGSQGQVQGGQNTNREEYIEVVMNNTAECGTSSSLSENLGILSSSSTTTTLKYFSVKTYLANSGYIVYTAGAAPTSTSGTSYTLATPNSGAGANAAGTERFGINLVDNSTPNIGVDPVQIPDATFSTGQATANYGTADSFRYVNGEAIANSNGKSSGTTCYTMSYLYNIANSTPAGNYVFTQSIVATSTY